MINVTISERLNDISLTSKHQVIQEKTWINDAGVAIDGCTHLAEYMKGNKSLAKPGGPIIPGLDATLCRTCATYWIDRQMRRSILEAKRGIAGRHSEAMRDNEI